MSTGFKVNIEKKTISNKNYRKVLYTTDQTQLVVMNIPVSGDIPSEVHPKTTQFIRIEKGSGQITVGSKKYSVLDGDSVIIPANTRHYVKNTHKSAPLLLYTIYSPPEHPPGLVQKTSPSPPLSKTEKQ
jgi:mannose-6-phosphate isomerase-like protein (cupin superfamily)